MPSSMGVNVLQVLVREAAETQATFSPQSQLIVNHGVKEIKHLHNACFLGPPGEVN